MNILFKQSLYILAAMTVITGSISTSFAEKIDIETQNILIAKLQSVLDLSEESVSKQNMKIRLADLYAERARQYAMQEEGSGEETHRKQIESDRSKALNLYTETLAAADTQTKSKIYLQMAHLNQMLGNGTKSKALFDKIIKDQKKYDPSITSQAHIESGDYEFNKQNFTKALEHFNKAIANKNTPRRNYAQYRIAWCHFHLGQTEVAIKKITTLLKTATLDTSFQEEASRDLATFLARRELKASEIETLMAVSPENSRIGNLTYLAGELDRTGKKKSALQVWAIIGSQNKSSDEDQLEGQIKIARIQYDLNKKTQTVVEVEKAAKMLVDCNSDDAQCKSNGQLLRKLITDWGLAEENKPSAELIQAYKVYVTYFPDLEINYWAGIASQKRTQWADSFSFYKNSAELSYDVKKDTSKKTLDKNIIRIFEGSLLAAIEVAEKSNSNDLKDKAYAQYLNLNPNGEKSLEVEYQMAQVLLSRGENQKAAEKFKEIALTKKPGSQSIKDKAADLALDTQVVLKDDATLEEWALEFAQKIPSRNKEFLVIARKSRLNQAANVINNSQSNSELEKQYEKLSKTDLSKASTDERIKFHKHKILIATKIKSLNAIIASTQSFLKEKGISAQDKNQTLQQLAWAYEMKLDFKNALTTLKKINPDKNKQDDHTLKLGLLTELSKKDPSSYYEKYIQISNDRVKKQEVAYNLVRLSKNKTKMFNKYKNILAGNAKFYMNAGIYAYEESKSPSLMQNLLAQKGAFNSFEGQLLARIKSIDEIQEGAKKLGSLKINSSNPKQLQKSVQERLSQISKFERITQKAIDKRDFTLQFLSLSILSKENTRLANNILALPVPKNLNKEQKKQYKKLVADQVQPYFAKSEEVNKKITELWNSKEDSSFNDVIELSTQPLAPGFKIARDEIKIVSQYAKRMSLSTDKFAKKWQERQKLSQQVSSLQRRVQQNPFDSNNLEQLKELESKLNRGPMVAYLDARLLELKTGGLN